MTTVPWPPTFRCPQRSSHNLSLVCHVVSRSSSPINDGTSVIIRYCGPVCRRVFKQNTVLSSERSTWRRIKLFVDPYLSVHFLNNPCQLIRLNIKLYISIYIYICKSIRVCTPVCVYDREPVSTNLSLPLQTLEWEDLSFILFKLSVTTKQQVYQNLTSQKKVFQVHLRITSNVRNVVPLNKWTLYAL